MMMPSSSTTTSEFAVASPLTVGVAMVLKDPSALALRMLPIARLALRTVAGCGPMGGATKFTI